MMTKREAEFIEQIVGSMTGNEYWGLVGWLANACQDPLWNCVRRRPRPTAMSSVSANLSVAAGRSLTREAN